MKIVWHDTNGKILFETYGEAPQTGKVVSFRDFTNLPNGIKPVKYMVDTVTYTVLKSEMKIMDIPPDVRADHNTPEEAYKAMVDFVENRNGVKGAHVTDYAFRKGAIQYTEYCAEVMVYPL